MPWTQAPEFSHGQDPTRTYVMLAGFGVFGRDKTMSQQAIFSPLDRGTLEALYRDDWISRKIVAFQEELDVDRVKKGDLKFVHVIERWMIAAGPVVRDVTSPWFGQPSYYMRSNMPVQPPLGGVEPPPSLASQLGEKEGSTFFIHCIRGSKRQYRKPKRTRQIKRT